MADVSHAKKLLKLLDIVDDTTAVNSGFNDCNPLWQPEVLKYCWSW